MRILQKAVAGIYNRGGLDMKKILFFAAFAAICSCVKVEPSLIPGTSDAPEQVEVKEVTITADYPKPASDQDAKSKTQIVGEGNVQWSPEDKVAICFPIDGYSLYDYKDYTNYSIQFTSQNQEVSESALFKGEWPVRSYNTSWGAVFYPETITFSSVSEYTSYRTRTVTTLKYTIPDVQYVEDNSFAKGVNLAYAPVSNADMDANKVNVEFRNLCALIKVVLPQEDHNIKSIKVESTSSNNDGVLHGEAVLSINTSNGTVTISTYPSSKPSLMLQKADGSDLTPGAAYYAVVWPNRSHAGFKFTFEDENGNEAEKFTPEGLIFTPYAGQYLEFNIRSLDFVIAPYLDLSTTAVTLKARGDEESSFFVSANNSWSASKTDSPWLTLVEDEEQNQVRLIAEANTSPDSRTATVTVTSSDLTRTVTVTQPPVYYQSTTGTPITTAASLEDGALYMIYFATGSQNNQIDTYCWKIDNDGNVSAYSFSDKTANATCDLVFKFTKSSTISGSWQTNGQDYLSASSGYLSSEYNKKYQAAGGSTILDFAASDTGSAAELIFANQWRTDSVYGSDIDIWNSAARSNTIYWSGGTSRTSGALGWGPTSNVPRKWFFVKVQEVK